MDETMAMPLNLSIDRESAMNKSKKKYTSLEDCVNERWKAATLKAIAERFACRSEDVISDNKNSQADSYEASSISEINNLIPSSQHEQSGQNANSILNHYHSFMQRRVVGDESIYDEKRNDIDESHSKRGKRKRKSSLRKLDSTHDNEFYDEFSSAYPAMKSSHTELSPIQSFVTNMTISERTIRQNNWALKVWRDWADKRNANNPHTDKHVPLEIDTATVDQMGHWLPRFIKEVRRRDGFPYPAETLMQIASGLQRYLRHVAGRQDMTFFDKYSAEFADFREALRSRSGEVKTNSSYYERRGSKYGGSASTSPTNDLFSLGCAKGIFRAIFYCNYMDFQITSMEDHHELQVDQYRVARDPQRREYVEHVGKEATSLPKKLYKSSLDSIDIVELFKTYFSHIPTTGPLYRRPLLSSDTENLRFSFNPVGINKLRETYKMLFTGGKSFSDLHKTKKTQSDDHNGKVKLTLVKSEPDPFKEEPHITPSIKHIERNCMTSSDEESLHSDVISDTANDDSTLVIHVPTTIKTVFVIQGNKRIKVDVK